MSHRLMTARTSFQAARTLGRSADAPRQRRHGHGFVVDVSAPQGSIDTDGDVRLAAALAAAVAPYDYADLDVLLADPDDAVIAESLAAALAGFADASVMLARSEEHTS